MKVHDLFFIEPSDVDKFCKKSDIFITLYGHAYDDVDAIMDNIKEVLEQKGIILDEDMSVSDVLVYKMFDMGQAHYGIAINKRWNKFPDTYEIMENLVLSLWKSVQAVYGKKYVTISDRYNIYRSLISRTSRDI